VKSPKNPCALQFPQGGDMIFLWLVFLEAGLAKWGRQKRIRTLEWLSRKTKQNKRTVHG